MDPVLCANQVFADGAPSLLCSCPAGLIHMHDCPVAIGLDCVHFREVAEEPASCPHLEFVRVHERLMADYLSRTYVHRVRSLDPRGTAFMERRAELATTYGEEEPEAGDEPDFGAYERERDKLLAERRRREEEREARRDRSREQKALERAKMGIKTVVEKAREAVADRGNVASSVVDELKLPEKSQQRRRRRRGPGKGLERPEGPARPPQTTAGGGTPKKRRRRRRRRKPKGDGPAS